MSTQFARTPNRKKPAPSPKVVLLAAFGLVGLITAVMAFLLVRNLVASWTLGKLPGAPLIDEPGTTAEQTAAVFSDTSNTLQGDSGPAPQPWDGSSRVSVLLMGLDYDDTEARRTPRTDSMMLVSMDPQTNTAGIMSIPRDLWVNIPGFDYGKINTAYFLGEAYQLPGGGPALAVQTAQEFLGVPINYYARIDFDAFTRFIDELGGVDINVKEEIEVSVMGGVTIHDEKGRTYTREEVTLYPGVQTLDGRTALAYARNRKTAGGDFDRAARQQQVVDAVRSAVLDFNMLPSLIAKAPKLYADLSSGVATNLSLNQIIQLALFAAKIPAENIRHGLISEADAYQSVSFDGQSILVPIMERIRAVRDETFGTSGPQGPVLVSQNPSELMKAEAAKVSIRNGSTVEGLAALSAEYFRQQGVTVTEEGTGDNTSASYIIDITGNPYTLTYFSQVLNLSPAQIRSASYDPNSPVDVIVVLGNDWAQNNPIGK